MSQHIVSAIELIGVAMGLLGFFYLSLDSDYFGAAGPSLVRPLLPSIAGGILIGVLLTLNDTRWFLEFVLKGGEVVID